MHPTPTLSPKSTAATEALRQLLAKYSAPAPSVWKLALAVGEIDATATTFISGAQLIQRPLSPALIPLLPWREERRFTELRTIVEKETVQNVSLLRFRCFSPAGTESLKELLYREFDLCEWIGGGTVSNIFSTITRDSVANIILRLSNGVVASVEASILQPAGSARQDRHEVIASRGVACDRVVDSQVAQESIYLFQSDRSAVYTDTDAELFGFAPEAVTLIRAALRQCQKPAALDALHARHQHLTAIVDAAFRSSTTNRRITL